MSTLANKIQDVLNEPGCGINQGKSEKERKKGCTKPLQPGGAAGGCAFDGAKIALQPITDVAHLVHGPIACEGHSWDNRNSGSSGSKLYRTSFTTDLSEQDVIFGGEKRLWRSIREIIEKYNPPAVFVYQTCVPAMTGDHIEAVCKKASQKFGTPCIPVNVPGFVGAKTIGNKLAGEALLDYVIGTQEPEYTTPYDINIIGEYNVAGELWQVKPLLDELGVRIRLWPWRKRRALTEMGCKIEAAVTTTQSPMLEKIPADEVLIGDLEDLENRAADCDLIVTHSHGRQMSERLGIPLFRYGLPTFDRLGAAHKVSVGYRGTRNLIFEIGNIFMAEVHEPTPDTWRNPRSEEDHHGAPVTAH